MRYKGRTWWFFTKFSQWRVIQIIKIYNIIGFSDEIFQPFYLLWTLDVNQPCVLQIITSNFARFFVGYIARVPWYSMTVSLLPKIHTYIFHKQISPRTWWLKEECHRGCSEESLMNSIASSFNTKSFSGFLKPWRSTTKSIGFHFQKSRTLVNNRISSRIQMIVWRFKENRLPL